MTVIIIDYNRQLWLRSVDIVIKAASVIISFFIHCFMLYASC